MENIDIINKVAKIICINILTYIVFIKLINYKENNYRKIAIVTIISIISSIVCLYLSLHMVAVLAIIITYCIYGWIIGLITKNKFHYSIIVTFMSLAITYVTYIISMILSMFILKSLISGIQIDNIGILVVGTVIQSFSLYRLFKINRLKNGLSFLQNKQRIDNIGFIGCILCGATILIYSLFGNSRGNKFNEYLIIAIIIEAICLTIWISKKLTAYYKQKLKQQTIEELENEIKEKEKEITRILEENKAIATINHKYSSRIKSLEKISTKIALNPEIMEKMKTEFGEDFADFQNEINKLSEEYSKEMRDKVEHKNNLPKTGIFGIDNILDYMSSEADKENIKFNLKINGNINYMVENVIDQSKLETLLGDHIKDAIIAIKHSNNTYKSILTIIGIVDDCYEVCIYDTGIEFEIETLLKLGKEAITTHKETGGSGIGFITTFETLKETKGSLIIEEKHQITNTDYTKAVRIRFDGKEEYKICSYRANKIQKQAKDNRIKIENI